MTQYQMRYARGFQKSGSGSRRHSEIECIVIVCDIEKVSCEVHQLHRDVLIEQSGRIRFGGVAQSWNISLGQRYLAESAAGSRSTMIEMSR
jgi:hypothetical protein